MALPSNKLKEVDYEICNLLPFTFTHLLAKGLYSRLLCHLYKNDSAVIIPKSNGNVAVCEPNTFVPRILYSKVQEALFVVRTFCEQQEEDVFLLAKMK